MAPTSRGTSWIGAEIRIHGLEGITLTLPERFVRELESETTSLLERPAIPVRRLRKFAGRIGWATGFLPTLGSMVAPLWAALSDSSKAQPRASATQVPTVRVAHALKWLRAFARRRQCAIVRTFTAEVPREDHIVELIFDASPWGYGGFLSMHGRYVSWFSEAITQEDRDRFGITPGECRHQALVECISILIGVRLWLPVWADRSTVVRVRSDSQAALQAMGKLRSPCQHINEVIRELALDLAEGRYHINVGQHIAGDLNTIADALSRLHQPGSKYQVPAVLMQVPRAVPPRRDLGWWEAAADPDGVPPAQLCS